MNLTNENTDDSYHRSLVVTAPHVPEVKIEPVPPTIDVPDISPNVLWWMAFLIFAFLLGVIISELVANHALFQSLK